MQLVKTKDDYGNIPVIPYNNNGITESILKTTNSTVRQLSDDNPLLCKDWKWRFPVKDILGNLIKDSKGNKINDNDFDSSGNLGGNSADVETDPYNVSNYTGGNNVRIKNRTPDRIGNGLFGYWDVDERAVTKLIDVYGEKLRKLEPTFLNVNSSNYEIKAAIFPEVELREPLFNQLFTSSEYTITKEDEKEIDRMSDSHYFFKK